MSPTHQDLSNDTTFSQIKSRVPVPLRAIPVLYVLYILGAELTLSMLVFLLLFFANNLIIIKFKGVLRKLKNVTHAISVE